KVILMAKRIVLESSIARILVGMNGSPGLAVRRVARSGAHRRQRRTMGAVSGSTKQPDSSGPESGSVRLAGLERPIDLRARVGPAPSTAARSTEGVTPSASATGPMNLDSGWSQLVDSLTGDVLLAHVPGLRVLDL